MKNPKIYTYKCKTGTSTRGFKDKTVNTIIVALHCYTVKQHPLWTPSFYNPPAPLKAMIPLLSYQRPYMTFLSTYINPVII